MKIFSARAYIFLSAAFLLFPGSLPAEDAVAQCNSRIDTQIRALLGNLRKVEIHYNQYRWTETKIRELVYNRLWKARRDSLDPLSKETRKAGKEEEERILPLLMHYEKESLVHSNGFNEELRKVQDSILGWGQCCPEKDFADCASEAFRQVDEMTEAARLAFGHVFEHEREFRTAVLKTAAGREGLYAEDALEEPARHDDYYWRFEAEREADRFAEDRVIRDYFHEIEKKLTWKFEGERCCLACGSYKSIDETR